MRGSFSSTLLVLALGAACAGERATKRDGEFKVALLTPGPISDQAWNGESYRGLIANRDSLGASISHIQTRTPASVDENFREYGRQSYDLVIGHGFEYKDAAERVATFPNTVYLITSSDVSGTNVTGIRVGFAQPPFLAGIAAAVRQCRASLAPLAGLSFRPSARDSMRTQRERRASIRRYAC